MACDALKRGRAKACKKHTGGVSKLYLFNFLEDSFTINEFGEVTSMNVLLTEAFEYDLTGDGQVLTEDGIGDDSAGTFVVTQTTTAILQGLDFETSNEMKAVAGDKPIAIVRTKDNKYLLVGDTEGINFNPATTTGTTQGEFNGYTLVGTSFENKLAPHLDESTITSFLEIVVANP